MTNAQAFRRLALLRILNANQTRYGLYSSTLAALIGLHGFPGETPADLDREMQTLASRRNGLTTQSNAAWQITAKGRGYLADRGY